MPHRSPAAPEERAQRRSPTAPEDFAQRPAAAPAVPEERAQCAAPRLRASAPAPEARERIIDVDVPMCFELEGVDLDAALSQ